MKNAVFILLGQSNATGHDLPMREEDKIIKPLKNVYGLERKYNQSFDTEKLTWSPYISAGTNLAEEQDDTYSLANQMARLWQTKIDEGHFLPDLYIIKIAIGAEGVTKNYMWYPEREKKLVPGKLGKVDISLFPFTKHIFSLVDASFKEMGKEYEIMGIHWRGGEEETEVLVEDMKDVLEGIYYTLFDGFYGSLGRKVPIILHKMASENRCMAMDPSGEQVRSMHYVNSLFDKLANDNENISLFDVTKAPFYTKDEVNYGIFRPDGGHYLKETNDWVAEVVFNEYYEKLRLSIVEPYFGKTVRVKMDRPIGTPHPKHPEIIYPINYGYIEGVFGGDGEELDVYILDVCTPIEECDAKIIGVVKRNNDVEDKLVGVVTDKEYTKEQIEKIIHFQEQFYDSHVEMV